jgi:hypothetical protein
MSDLPFAITASFVRPADTTAYAAGDLVANNTTAANVIPLKFKVSRNPMDGVTIRKAQIVKSGNVLTNAQFRLYLFDRPPVPSVGDNAAFNSANTLAVGTVAGLIGFFDVTLARAGTAGARGAAVPDIGTDVIGAPQSDEYFYGLLEAIAAYTPVSGETFTVTLQGGRQYP